MADETKSAEVLAAEAKAKEDARIAEEKRKEEERKARTFTYEEHQKEINDVVAERESNKKKYRETREKLETLEKKLEGLPDGEALKKILDEKKALEDFKKQIDEKTEKEKLEKASEVEKLQHQLDKIKTSFETELKVKQTDFERTAQQLKDELEKKTKVTQDLFTYKRDMEILRVAEKCNALKPSQVVDMLSHKLVFEDDTYVFPIINVKGKREGEKTVEEYVKGYLEDPENENLIKADVKSGSDHQRGRTTTTTSGRTDADKYLKSDRKILEEEAEERGLKVEDWSAIKTKQEDLKKAKSAK